MVTAISSIAKILYQPSANILRGCPPEVTPSKIKISTSCAAFTTILIFLCQFVSELEAHMGWTGKQTHNAAYQEGYTIVHYPSLLNV